MDRLEKHAAKRPPYRRVGRRRKVAAAAQVAYVAVLLVAVGCMLLDVAPTASFVVVGASTLGALVLGPLLHRPRSPLVWRLMTGTCSLFIASALLRGWSTAQEGWQTLTSDLLSGAAYALIFGVFVCLLRARQNADPHAVLDCVTICVSTGLAVVVLLALPAAELPGRPGLLAMVATIFPLLDVVLLLLTLHLSFTSARRSRSVLVLGTALLMMFAGDTLYAAMIVDGEPFEGMAMRAPYLVSYACVGLAALHPSMRLLTEAQPRPVQSWSAPRVVLLSVALVIPSALALVRPPDTSSLLAAYVAVNLLMVAALLLRAVSAVRSSARGQLALRHSATHDALTGLPNRALLLERLGLLLQQSPPQLYLLFIDLDDFKLVNDSYGHSAGDELLVQVAARLRGAAPDAELVARLGGDEFVVVAAGGDEERRHGTGPYGGGGPRTLAENLLRAFETPFALAEASITVTPSIGVAVADPDGSSTIESLLREADTALYCSKTSAHACWTVFDESMHVEARDRLDTEQLLRAAFSGRELRFDRQPVD